MWKFALKAIHVFERKPPLWLKEWKRRGTARASANTSIIAVELDNVGFYLSYFNRLLLFFTKIIR